MRKHALLLALVAGLLLGACSGGSSPATSGSSGGATSVAISVQPTGAPMTAMLTRAEGGTLVVTLADGDTAALVVPAGALESDTLVSLVPLRTADGVGVDLRPNGLWLDRAAKLTFGRGDRWILARSTAARDADRFTLTGNARSSTSIIRFRPILVTADVPKGLVPPAPGPGGARGYESEPGVYAFPHDPRPDEVDPIDDLAGSVERDVDSGSTDGPGASGTTAIRKAADEAANKQTAACDDRTSGAASRLADTMQTAGSGATSGKKPTCVKRVVEIVSQFNLEGSSNGISLSQESIVAGHGMITADEKPTNLSFPLEGQQRGVAEALSYGTSGLIAGFGKLMSVETPPMNGGSCDQSALQGGVVTGTASLGPDSVIQLGLQPQGTYTFTCKNWFEPMTLEATVLSALRDFDVPFPIVVSVPDGRNVVRVLGQILQSAEAMALSSPGGKLTYSMNGLTISLSLTVGVYWSRADRCDLTAEEKAMGPAYEREVCGSGPN